MLLLELANTISPLILEVFLDVFYNFQPSLQKLRFKGLKTENKHQTE